MRDGIYGQNNHDKKAYRETMGWEINFLETSMGQFLLLEIGKTGINDTMWLHSFGLQGFGQTETAMTYIVLFPHPDNAT